MQKQFKKTDTAMYIANKTWGDHWEYASIDIIEGLWNKVLKTQEKKLLYCGNNSAKDVKDLKGWDVKYGIYDKEMNKEMEITFEIKADKATSDNVFFEKTCSKKPSGVYTTTSMYFIYIMPRYDKENFFIIKPANLIKLLDTKNYHLTYGGEGNRVTGYLADKRDFTVDFKEAGGKVYSFDMSIPEKFNVSKFISNSSSNTMYYGDSIMNYPDPFDWANLK